MSDDKIKIDWDVPRWTVPEEANFGLSARARWMTSLGHIVNDVADEPLDAGRVVGKTTDGWTVVGSPLAWADAEQARDAVGIDWDKPMAEFGPNFWPFYSSLPFMTHYRLAANGDLTSWPFDRPEPEKSSGVIIGRTTDGKDFVGNRDSMAAARKQANR